MSNILNRGDLVHALIASKAGPYEARVCCPVGWILDEDRDKDGILTDCCLEHR